MSQISSPESRLGKGWVTLEAPGKSRKGDRKQGEQAVQGQTG